LTAINKRKDDKVPFGKGNVRGVIGPEGANLSHKATAYFPTVLFGIPGAPFEVLVLALLAYVGLDLGSPRLLQNQNFFTALSFGYMASLLITVIISIFFIRYAIKLTQIPKQIWFPFLLIVIVWSCTRHTGGWNDYIILGIFCIIGFTMRYFKINRIAFLIGFVLSAKIEKIGSAYWQLYNKEPWMFLTRPVSIFLVISIIGIIIYALRFKANKIDYY
jgi:TctA family transporter